jgi:3-methylcrotonyl-CoA carboxylase alpha subunit
VVCVSDPPLRINLLGDGRYEIVTGTRRRLAYAIRSGSDTWVFLDGRVHVISTSSNAGRSSARQADEFALAAPMPATVAAVHVTPGQQVTRGDVLITLEAMKMELSIKAPRDGRVRAIACRIGDLVQPGVPLVEME